ncbi:MAG: FAD-binding oxidoreductase [Candidatus Pacebacteria bacterium]|nr:FAD-binding oxidoreductase [Candidatus Paceibacterota bacterium]
MKDEIKKFFKGDVDDSRETLNKYSHDASLLEVKPKLVLYPKDSLDVQNIVKWVNYTKKVRPTLSITARCAGTDMSGGAIGPSIILDFTRYMNHLVKFIDHIPQKYPGSLTQKEYSITVQPGMYYRDFEKITLEKSLILPCYTASKSLNAMGGMYGNNSAGERTLKYGKTEDYVLSAKVIFSDGNEYVVKPLNLKELAQKMAEKSFEGEVYKQIYNLIEKNKEEIKEAKPKVSKNSAGYYIWNVMTANGMFDLNKLLVGSQGTLGIVTEITFKVLPDIKHTKLVAVFMQDLMPLGRLVDEMLTLDPETLETYDDKTLALAVKFFPDFLKNKGLVGMFKMMWSFLPEFFMMVRGGFPKMVILAQFAGNSEEEVQKKCEALVAKIKPFGLKTHITKNESEANKYWDIRRDSFALLRKHVKGKRTAPFIDDIIVRPEFLPKFIPELNKILSKYDLTYTIAGHAGDGNFHIIPLMDFSRPDTAQIITELSDKVYDLVMHYHGSITAEHNDGIIRTPYLEKMFGARVTAIFKDIKFAFDPKNILNPGKKVPTEKEGGTREYISSHLAIEHKVEHKV